MAEGKKSFVAYSDWYGMFKALPDEVAGKLIKHIFSYVNDENPISEDFIINALFEQVKSTLKRDLNKWEAQTEQRKKAGLRSAEIRKQNATSVNERSNSSTDSVSVSVNDNVTVTEINSNLVFRKINHLSISFEDFEKLKKDFDEKDILDCFDRIENYKDNHKYISLFLTAKQWLNKQKKDKLKEESNGKTKSTPVIGRQTAETIEHNLQGWDKPTYD